MRKTQKTPTDKIEKLNASMKRAYQTEVTKEISQIFAEKEKPKEETKSLSNSNTSQENSESELTSNMSFDSEDEEFDIYESKETLLISKKLDKHKEKQIINILNVRYIYGFLRILRTLVYLSLILITVIGIVIKSNIYSIISLIALVPLIFKRFNYKSMKLYNLFLIILMLLEYLVTLSNLSNENSPIQFPRPYNPNFEDYRDFPLPMPWAENISHLQKNPDWAYFLGVSDAQRTRNGLWFEWS